MRDMDFFMTGPSKYGVKSMDTHSENMSISEMTEGISERGMDDYLDNLKAHLLKETTSKVNDIGALESAINAGWQGRSRDEFVKKFNEVREAICYDLDREFDDLQARLEELKVNYFNQDEKMIDVI